MLSITFTDPVGDAKGGPDITSLVVDGSTATGSITFTLTAPGLLPASPDDLDRQVVIAIDTDKRRATGDPADGTEYALVAGNDSTERYWFLDRWTGTTWRQAPESPTARFNRTGDVLAWTVSTIDIGGTKGPRFYVLAGTWDPADRPLTSDFSPNDEDWWSFDLPATLVGRLTITDLGALPGDQVSEAVAINDLGQVIGYSRPKSGGLHAFLWENGTMQALGTLGGKESSAEAIDEQGRIVGWSETAATDEEGDPFSHAVLWQEGTPIDLGTLGGEYSSASAINGLGQIAGYSDTKAQSAKYGRAVEHAFLWSGGNIRDLGALGGEDSYPDAINERGQIVGSRYTKAYKERAFLWQNGTMRDLGTLGGPESDPSGGILMELVSKEARAINDRGQVVGWADTKKKDKYGYVHHAFLWQKGKMRDLGTLGGKESEAIAINERGQVVGYAETKVKDPDWGYLEHAFLWDKGKMRDLGTMGGRWSRAVAINDRGQVVIGAEGGHAFLWQNGKLTDLGTLGEWHAYPLAINERGQIVGSAGTVFGEKRAVLWTYEP